MTAPTVDVYLQSLIEADRPEEIFGERVDSPGELLRKYKFVAAQVHPDINHDPAAHDAFLALNRLFEEAKTLLRAGTYGQPRGFAKVKTSRGREYAVSAKLTTGDIADIFQCSGTGAPDGVFKIARHPRDNDLLKAEGVTLTKLLRDIDDRFHPFLPKLIDTVGLRRDRGIVLQANIFERLDGWYTLEQVRQKKYEIDPKDMAWIWRRLLYILHGVHRSGIVHGAVLPSHVMIHPELHGLVLLDWCYAVPEGRPIRAVAKPYRDWYPTEVFDRQGAGPETDIYMGARSMLALVGGAGDGRPPETLPRPLRAFFRACTLPRQLRPDDAWELKEMFEEVLERLYGPRKFRPFTMDD